ncbi:hybrid sensor histidine kinase/response regulator [Alteromonas lipotrueiana]|uniref:hybrid sensor histidine kinase/response regulator n=1 Tax=Alteromonas lipotrueiana TaxID=2803815 RepID=UPI001C48F996|nr:response regulator [Alteromonas lipotrueiana]
MITTSRVNQTITRTYWYGASLVIALIGIVFIIYQYQLSNQQSISSVLSVARQQPLLVQRIGLLENLLQDTQDANEQTRLQRELRQKVDVLTDNHQQLIADPAGLLKHIDALTHESHFFGGPQSLDGQLQLFAERGRRIAEQSDGNLSFQPISYAALSELTRRVEKTVNLLTTEQYIALTKQQRTTQLLFILLALGLLGGLLWLFYPLRKLLLEQHNNVLEANYHAAQQQQLAREASIAKHEFLMRMSHEFRTPIASMLGAIELLPNMPEKQVDLIANANEAAHQLLSLTNNLIDTLGSTELKEELPDQPFDLIRLIDECVSMYSYQCKKKNLELHCEEGDLLPQYVQGAPQALAKSIKNLLDNAVKFTDSGSVTVAMTMTSINQSNGVLGITICDTGAGISKNEKEAIFQPFYRGKLAHHNNSPGAGVGLGVARQHLQANNGDLTLLSTSVSGSCFELKLPLQIVTDRYQVTPTPHQAKFAVIDDIAISRQHLTNLIESQGFNVDSFVDGNALLEQQVDITQYKALIVDYFMPALSGIELSSLLRDTFDDKLPPIIFVSATPDIANLVHGFDLPIWQTFVKPVDRNRFVDTLHHLANDGILSGVEQRKANILVVEDEPINQEIMKDMVENLGYKCWLASTAQVALEATLKKRFDVILMDINLPDKSGLELAEQILTSGTTTPMVAVTANAYETDREASRMAGIRYHLVKPVAYQELRHTLKQALLIR